MTPTLLLAAILAGAEPAEAVKSFEGSYSDAIAKGASKKVLLFVDFYTDWCGWCKVLDQKVYTDAVVAEVLNGKFVPMKINAEKGEGKDLQKEFKVTGFPTSVIIDPQTKKEVDRIVGYAPPEKYLEMLKKILAGDTFAALCKMAQDNPKDLEIWAKYADVLEGRGERDEIKAAWKKVADLDPDGSKGKAPQALFALARIAAMEKQSLAPVIEFAQKNEGKPVALEAHRLVTMWLERSKKEEDKKLQAASFEYLITHGARDPEIPPPGQLS